MVPKFITMIMILILLVLVSKLKSTGHFRKSNCNVNVKSNEKVNHTGEKTDHLGLPVLLFLHNADLY